MNKRTLPLIDNEGEIMVDHEAIQMKLKELSERKWKLPAIEARCRAAVMSGFPRKKLNHGEMLADRKQILDRVQLRAEEYNYYAGNCARSTALAMMEEFGLGNMEVLKALSPFPGFASTGWMCGAVTGGMIALGLFGGSEDLDNLEATGFTMKLGKRFMERFGQEIGAYTCPKIQEDVVFGRYMDPGASPENMKAFEQARGFEKCSLLPGIGARIAAEIIIDHL
jgi:C_GCAxxG_C_C family probable redox protein